MSDEEDIRRERAERLHNVFIVLSDQLRHEDERLSDTYNIFVLVQTILFAALIQLNTLTQSLYSNNAILHLMKNIIPITGTLLCLNGLYSIHRRVEAMSFWKEKLYQIEADSNYVSGNLDIYTARKMHLEKKHSKYPGFIFGILNYQRYYIGILFLIGWILALIVQLYSYL
jgi:hypothetical protein